MTTKRNLIEALRANRRGLYQDLRDILDDSREIERTKTHIPREIRQEFTMDLLKVEMVINQIRRKLNIKK